MTTRKSIFITGGGSGIGRAIAEYFAGRGWFVGIGDIDTEGMKGTAALLPDDACFTHKFDVRDRAAWDVALDAFSEAASGRIDVLANNAGIPIGGAIEQNSVDEITRCLDINLKGVLFGAQAVLPYLKQTAPGSCLLNTASAAGIYGTPGASVYTATKFGVRGITESLDAEWVDFGINVRSICPSFIDTPLLEHNPNHGSNEAIRSQVQAASLEITPVLAVAQAAWDAVHGERLHTLVGRTAKRIGFAARWMPGRVRKDVRGSLRPLGK